MVIFLLILVLILILLNLFLTISLAKFVDRLAFDLDEKIKLVDQKLIPKNFDSGDDGF